VPDTAKGYLSFFGVRHRCIPQMKGFFIPV